MVMLQISEMVGFDCRGAGEEARKEVAIGVVRLYVTVLSSM